MKHNTSNDNKPSAGTSSSISLRGERPPYFRNLSNDEFEQIVAKTAFVLHVAFTSFQNVYVSNDVKNQLQTLVFRAIAAKSDAEILECGAKVSFYMTRNAKVTQKLIDGTSLIFPASPSLIATHLVGFDITKEIERVLKDNGYHEATAHNIRAILCGLPEDMRAMDAKEFDPYFTGKNAVTEKERYIQLLYTVNNQLQFPPPIVPLFREFRAGKTSSPEKPPAASTPTESPRKDSSTSRANTVTTATTPTTTASTLPTATTTLATTGTTTTQTTSNISPRKVERSPYFQDLSNDEFEQMVAKTAVALLFCFFSYDNCNISEKAKQEINTLILSLIASKSDTEILECGAKVSLYLSLGLKSASLLEDGRTLLQPASPSVIATHLVGLDIANKIESVLRGSGYDELHANSIRIVLCGFPEDATALDAKHFDPYFAGRNTILEKEYLLFNFGSAQNLITIPMGPSSQMFMKFRAAKASDLKKQPAGITPVSPQKDNNSSANTATTTTPTTNAAAATQTTSNISPSNVEFTLDSTLLPTIQALTVTTNLATATATTPTTTASTLPTATTTLAAINTATATQTTSNISPSNVERSPYFKDLSSDEFEQIVAKTMFMLCHTFLDFDYNKVEVPVEIRQKLVALMLHRIAEKSDTEILECGVKVSYYLLRLAHNTHSLEDGTSVSVSMAPNIIATYIVGFDIVDKIEKVLIDNGYTQKDATTTRIKLCGAPKDTTATDAKQFKPYFVGEEAINKKEYFLLNLTSMYDTLQLNPAVLQEFRKIKAAKVAEANKQASGITPPASPRQDNNNTVTTTTTAVTTTTTLTTTTMSTTVTTTPHVTVSPGTVPTHARQSWTTKEDDKEKEI